MCRMPVFSGRVNQRVNLDGDLFKTLLEDNVTQHSGPVAVSVIVDALYKVKKKIGTIVKENQNIRFGTTSFYKFDEVNGYGDPVEIEPTLTKMFFYGQDYN